MLCVCVLLLFDSTQRQLDAMEESVLAQQRQRFEEMQDYMRAQQQQQAATAAAAAATTANAAARAAGAGAGAGGRVVFDSSKDPYSSSAARQTASEWDRPPSAIPAPLSGAGIGYGVHQAGAGTVGSSFRSNAQQAADLEDVEYVFIPPLFPCFFESLFEITLMFY
jgi:hypothetical protein